MSELKLHKWQTKCKLCKRQFSNPLALSTHIARTHKIPIEKYYRDIFGRGKCLYCGARTTFINLNVGYHKYCCNKCATSSPLRTEAIHSTVKERYDVDNVGQLESTKKKQRKTWRRKHNVDHISQLQRIKDQKAATCLKHWGHKSHMQSEEFFEHFCDIMEDKHGKRFYFQTEEFKDKAKQTKVERYDDENYNNIEKARQTYYDRTGYYSPAQNPEVIEYKKELYFEKTGYHSPAQNPEVYAKIFKNKDMPGSEKYFIKLLKSNKIKYKCQYLTKKENVWQHHFDFAIFKKEKLDCLVEVDGEYYHGISDDCDGHHATGHNDFLRWKLVPDGVKFLVIDSERLDEGFDELLNILPMSYKKWKKEMLRSIPRNIKDAIPKFEDKRMLKDWRHLCNNGYFRNAFLGKSILLHFCKSRWNTFDWKTLRKTVYKSPVSGHHLLEGFEVFKNTSELRERFRKKYKDVDEVIVSRHSPEKMLAICSLGKTYISKEKIDKESIKIIKFLGLKAYQFYSYP